MFTLKTTLVTCGNVVCSELGDEWVLLDLTSGIYHGLDAVAGRIWVFLQEPATPLAIRDRLLAEYDVEPARCEKDLMTLLADLQAKGLVESAEALQPA